MHKNIEQMASRFKNWWDNLNTEPKYVSAMDESELPEEQEEQEDLEYKSDEFNSIAYLNFDVNAAGNVRLVFDSYAISDLHSTNLAALMYAVNNGMLEDVMITKAIQAMEIPQISKFIEDVLSKYRALIETNENMSVINPEDTFSIGKTGKRNTSNESIS